MNLKTRIYWQEIVFQFIFMMFILICFDIYFTKKLNKSRKEQENIAEKIKNLEIKAEKHVEELKSDIKNIRTAALRQRLYLLKLAREATKEAEFWRRIFESGINKIFNGDRGVAKEIISRILMRDGLPAKLADVNAKIDDISFADLVEVLVDERKSAIFENSAGFIDPVDSKE